MVGKVQNISKSKYGIQLTLVGIVMEEESHVHNIISGVVILIVIACCKYSLVSL